MEPSFGENLVEILPQLRWYALSRVDSANDANDLVQKTCLRAWERQKQFTLGTRLIAWTIMIMKNIQIDESRKRIKLVQSDPEVISEVPDPHSHRRAEGVLELNSAYRAIQKLSIECREILMLAAQGFSYKELSELLDIRKKTVGTRLLRCRKKLDLPFSA